MPRGYTVGIENGTLATASGDYEVFELLAADDKPIELRSIVIKTTSELQEAQEEWLRIQVIRGYTTAGTGGSAGVTVGKLSANDSNAGFTAATLRTALGSAGTAVAIWTDAFQVRAGFELFKAPLEGFWTGGADYLSVRLTAATTDDASINANIEVWEYP